MRSLADNRIWRDLTRWALMGCVLGLLIGCVSDRAQPSQQSQQEIRSDADRFFEKMEVEETKRKSKSIPR